MSSSSVDRRRRDNNNNNDNRRRDPTPDRDRNRHRRDDDRHHHNNNNRQQNSHHDQQRRQRDYDDDEYDDHNSRNRNNRDENRGRNNNDNRRNNHSDDKSNNNNNNNQRNNNYCNDRDRDRNDRSRRYDDDRDRDRNGNRHDDHYRGSSSNNNNNNNNRRGVDDRNGNHQNNNNNSNNNNNHHHHHHHHHHHQESSAPRLLGIPPSYYRCHICTKANHWVIQCPTLTLVPGNRKFFPHLSVSCGCAACGQRGHESAACPNQVALCLECRGIHFPDTKKCPFARPASIWHEFLDKGTGLPYYVEQQQENRNTRLGILPVPVAAKVCDFFTNDEEGSKKNSDEVKKNEDASDALASVTTWSPPENPGDIILWYCDHCKHLLPAAKYSVCPCCKLARFR